MRTFPLIATVLLAFTLGCNSVTVDKPFGKAMDGTVLDSLRGTWVDDRETVYYVERGETSDFVVAFTEWDKETHEFKARNIPMDLRLVGDRPLLFVSTDVKRDDCLAFMWLSRMEDDALYARSCDPKVFRKAVADGELDGEVTKRGDDLFDVRLRSSPALAELLATPEASRFFGKESDQPLRRLSKPGSE